jgi:hypothetical protein
MIQIFRDMQLTWRYVIVLDGISVFVYELLEAEQDEILLVE